MEVLIGAIVFLFLALIGGTYLSSRFKKNKDNPEKEEIKEVPSDCCGAHEVCEYDSEMVKTEKPVYFDDEELDQYIDKGENSYNDDQIDEFREVLYTLQTKEINSWLKSLELRKINLPSILNQEARQLISDYINERQAS